MSLRKIVTLSAASVLSLATFSAFAGGTETVVSNYAPVPQFTPNVYVGLGLGGAYSNWDDFIFGSGSHDGARADNGGFAWGGKLGYQASDHFGIEGGIFGLPESDVSFKIYDDVTKNTTTVRGDVNSWFAYVAGTIRASVIDPNLHVTGKVGGALRNVDHSGKFFDGVGDGSYGTVMFGAGLDYDLRTHNLPLSIGAEYMLIPGTNNLFDGDGPTGIDKDAAPTAHVFLATLNYHFAI